VSRLEPYPLLLSAKPKVSPWGASDWSGLTGRSFDHLPRVGELWLNDDRPNGSVVLEGPLAGLELGQVIALDPEQILGRAWGRQGRFPILIKFLNTSQWLSIQVHPGDGGPASPSGPLRGKTEAWHVLSAGPGAGLILGLKPGLGRDDLAEAMGRGRVAETVAVRPVSAGQSFLIPGGLIHSIGPDLLLFEIQQNNDLTYRIYDWDRPDPRGLPRPLHPRRSLEAINFNQGPVAPLAGAELEVEGGRRTYLAACRHFLLSRLELRSPFRREARKPSSKPSFVLLTAVQGRGLIRGGAGQTGIEGGETVLIPAGLEEYEIVPHPNPSLVLLESRPPDLREELIAPLKAGGFGDREIEALAGDRGPEELGPALKGWDEV